MSTHADWVAAKTRRDNAAFFLASAYVAGNDRVVKEESAKFLAAESEMKKLERELDGRDPE